MPQESKRNGAGKKEGGSGTLIVLILGGALVLVCCAGTPIGLGVWWFVADRAPAAPKKAEGDQKDVGANKGVGAPKVSRANYDRLQDRMTLAQVQAILGVGQELGTKPGDRHRDFVWRANEGGRQIVINLSFDNGALVGRSIEQ